MGALFALVGYAFYKLGCEPAPLLLGFILGPMMEENLRRSMLMSGGDPSVFVRRPLSAAFIIATVLILAVMVVPAVRARRVEIAD
jgi:TctA family transporter